MVEFHRVIDGKDEHITVKFEGKRKFPVVYEDLILLQKRCSKAEQDGLYIFDGKRVSELYIPSGKTKKKISKLQCLMNDVCALNVSQNGQFLCGALCDGKIFLWEKDKDRVQFITGLPKVFNDADKGNTKNRIFYSSCGRMLLLMIGFEKLFLWQKIEEHNPDDSHNIIGTWSQVHHGEYSLPDQSNKETAVDGVFYSDEVVGRCGAFSYVFNKGTELVITSLIVKSRDEMNVSNLAHNILNQDEETTSREVVENVRCSIKWKSITRPLYAITPATRLVKGRFVYVCRYSPDGQILAIVLNQKLAKNTRLLFCSTLHSTSRIVDMKCCGGSDQSSGRTWWVSDIAWIPDSLLLIGITRNGALFITSKLGEPINLITTGNGMDLGPSLFLSLHPRITVKSFQENIPPENSEISSSSEKDIFHQKFSVAVHPYQPLALCSDGYMVTIFHLNSKPDHSKLITDLTKDVSRFLSSDAALLEQSCGSLEKSVHGMSGTVSSLLSKFRKDVSEHSSPGSTLSETATGFGIARDIEAGVMTFGETEGIEMSSVTEMNDQQRLLKAEDVLLQVLGIGTSCGRHWSQNMPVAMNLILNTWEKLFTVLLEDESNCGLSDKDALFHNTIAFVESCFEAFRWDMTHQHCLPWFTQFLHSTVKCLVDSKNFGFSEIIDVGMKLLRMAEAFLHEIYAWSAVSNCTTVHFLGDSFSPSSDACVVPRTRNDATNSGDHCSEQPVSQSRCASLNNRLHSDSDPSRNIKLDSKLDQSWLTLYHYVCKTYKSKKKIGSKERHSLDEKLVEIICWIQRKLQATNTPRNLILGNKAESLSDQGYKMYLDGNYAQAAELLERSFHETSEGISSTETKDCAKPHLLELSIRGTPASSRQRGSRFGASLIEDDLSSKLSADIDTLLSIVYINLENYDLKAALALVYSFIHTACGVNLQDFLDSEGPHEGSPTVLAADDSEVKVTSTSSLKVLQLSVLVKYPLAWVVDNRAIPLVQELARFMACYFTNLPLAIPTPFYSQKSLHLLEESNKGNIAKARSSATEVKKLSQRRLTEAIGQQKLESLWTADHTMELLLISGLLGEAAWFANCLGDWKIAFLLSVTEVFRKKNQSYVEKKSHGRATSVIRVPQPEQLMKEKINMVLKLDASITETDVEGTREMFTDEHISCLQNVLEASVITELDLVPGMIKQLVVMLRESISKLDWMVTQDMYLPAPPLYCPQPARNDGDVLSEETRKEIFLRTEIANVVQKILALYRASSCFLYCAQEYCKHVVTKLSEGHALPTIINEFITTEGVQVDTPEDLGSGVIRSFQEFCGLMWLLNVRDELALSSRRYSKLKQSLSLVRNDGQMQEIISQCEEVLVWLKRLLPFSVFLNAIDDVLDGILTLLSELPLNCETVDLLARYFHTPSPSLRVPTTEKLNRMTRKIRNNAEHSGLENGESLAVRFQQQCEKQRKEENGISAQPLGHAFLEHVPVFCKSLDYQDDFAFLRFLDTFLLITLAKNVTSDDYKKTPLILPYKDKPTLETEVSSIEATTRGQGQLSRKSTTIQRSQSFQDVGNLKKKPESSLLSPDYLDSPKHKPVNRSNSLTDLRRIQSSLSEELQAFLPILLWLKRWCLIDEYQKGNQGANKSYSFLNMTTTPTAIRVLLPLKLVVNTLWLFDNYYKDFAEAKGRCLRDKRSRAKKKKRTREKEIVSEGSGKDVPLTAIKEKAVGELPLVAEVQEENVKVDDVGESVEKREPRGSKRVRRRRVKGMNDTKRNEQTADDSEEATKEIEAKESLRMESEDKMGENIGRIKIDIKINRGVNGTEEGREEELPEQRLRVRKRLEKKVNASHLKEQGELGSRDRISGKHLMHETFVDDPPSEPEGSVTRTHKYLNQFEQVENKGSQDSVISGTVLTQTDEEKVSDQDFSKEGSSENISSRSGIRKNLFPSPISSSVGSKWKSFESVDTDLPLFSFSFLDGARMASGGKIANAFKSRMASDSDITSNVTKPGMVRTYPRLDDDVSLTSESLSVGQIRNDVAMQMKVAADVNSDTSVATEKYDQTTKHRKAAKRKIYDESSSESSDQPRVKPKDEGSLLRRIIRSEMRKFIKAQQAEIRSKSSTFRTTDENLSDDLSKDEIQKTKAGKSRVKSSQEPYTSSENNRNKTNEELKYRSSQLPFKDTQLLSAPVDRQPQSDPGSSYQAGDDTSSSYPRCDHRVRSHVAASATHDAVQNLPQMFPPLLNQFPTVSGWPVWYNPSFPAPPPWLWPGSAPKVNSDKGTQVEDTGNEQIAENNPEMSKIPPLVDSQLANNEEDVHDETKDTMVAVAVQTDVYLEKEEFSAEVDLGLRDSTVKNNTPFLLSLNEKMDVRNENEAREKQQDIAKYSFPSNKEHASNTCSDDQQEFSQQYDVFAKDLSTEHSHALRNPETDSASALDGHFAIPLLKFSTEVHSRAPESLPFKIAWPEHPELDTTTRERVELPLLQLGDGDVEHGDMEYFAFPASLNSRRLEDAPLLHFSHQNDQDRHLSEFRLVQVPENENLQFPLLYLPDTGTDPPILFSEQGGYAGDPKKDKTGRKREQKRLSGDKNFVTEARMKRRNQVAGSVTTRQTTMKPTQHREPILKQASSESPSSELEANGTARVTVRPAKKSTRGDGSSKKTKPRRDKLHELNNIIRDLQRDITNDNDLIVSEVSSILSPEIRYENFEKKAEVPKYNEHESSSTRKLATASVNVNKERHIDDNDGINQKSTISRLHKPSTVSARDIHTEIPSDVPEQPVPVDAKVGTVNILRFPVSVQTDTVESPAAVTLNNLPTSPPRLQTRELSIQTEPESRKAPAKSSMRDAAINTENVVEGRTDEINAALSLYPRVPADVYLDIQDIDEKPSTNRVSAVDSEQRNSGRKFLSVVDIAEDDVRRQIQDKNETIEESEDKFYRKDEDIPSDKDSDVKNDSRAVSMSSTAEDILPEDVEKGDHSTVAAFSSMDLQRSSLNQPASRGNSLQQAQKLSKEKLSQRLLEMNEQFDAIEQLSSNMEQDIQRSNRLLRTIENLNKVTDHVSIPEVNRRQITVGERVAETVQSQTHNVTARVRQPPDAADFQHRELNYEQMPQRRELRQDALQEDKKSVLKSRPWINKPIEQLTNFVSDDRTEERSLDSLENSQEKMASKSDTKDMSDISDGVSNLRNDIEDTEDMGDLGGDGDTMGGVQSRKSSISNASNAVKSHVDSGHLVNPETARSDRRFKLSLSPEDVLNVSREKLKDILAGTTTSTAANTRDRDKTSQRQQELREWMTKKRKLRHKEWTQKLNEDRQTEFKPFQSKIQGEQTSMSSKKLKKCEKERKDNRRTQTKEHVDERLLSAYDLMNEMVTEHVPKGPALITPNSVGNTQRAKEIARVKANNRYKENRAINSKPSKKKQTEKPRAKVSNELYSTRTIPVQSGLTGTVFGMRQSRDARQTGLTGTELGVRQSRDAPVYEYDIEKSARQFITRKSYDSYQQKMSASFDFDQSISLRRHSPFNLQFSPADPRVDELLEDVSLGDPLDLQRLDNLDSLLSGDSELRDLLNDVIADKPDRDLLETRDDGISRNTGFPRSRNVENRWRGPSPVEGKREILDSFNMDRKGNNKVKRHDSERLPKDVLSDEDDNLEMSDEVAALLAEAKAAVGDDFSGTSEVGDIDWNEVDDVLQQN